MGDQYCGLSIADIGFLVPVLLPDRDPQLLDQIVLVPCEGLHLADKFQVEVTDAAAVPKGLEVQIDAVRPFADQVVYKRAKNVVVVHKAG